MHAEAARIQDYSIIGNGRSVALVLKRGSLDWFCWPRFDSEITKNIQKAGSNHQQLEQQDANAFHGRVLHH
jgi:GH15 family glucan-1,4-alpha-glucosidase